MTATPPTSARAPRLDSLTSLRAVAALLVFGYHAAPWVPGTVRFLVLPGGQVGVAFFFVLSGFVLAWTMRPGDRARDFYQRRVARVVPASWASIVLTLLLMLGAGIWTAREVISMVPSVFFLQAWFADEAMRFAGNQVLWTLSVEAFFYATFPLWAPRLRALGDRALRRAAVTLLGAAVAYPLVVHALTDATWTSWLANYAPPGRLIEFAAGAALGLLTQRRALLKLRLSPVVVGCLAAYGAASLAPATATRSIALLPLAALVVAGAQADLEGRSGVLHYRWFLRAGAWSFCFYLVHLLVIRAFYFVPSAEGAWQLIDGALFLTTLVLSVPAAAALHHWVEMPAERRLRPKNPHGAGAFASDLSPVKG